MSSSRPSQFRPYHRLPFAFFLSTKNKAPHLLIMSAEFAIAFLILRTDRVRHTITLKRHLSSHAIRVVYLKRDPVGLSLVLLFSSHHCTQRTH